MEGRLRTLTGKGTCTALTIGKGKTNWKEFLDFGREVGPLFVVGYVCFSYNVSVAFE